jgi:hypothetical protein
VVVGMLVMEGTARAAEGMVATLAMGAMAGTRSRGEVRE